VIQPHALGPRSQTGTPAVTRLAIALGLPMVAAMVVLGTYLNKEILVTAGLIALSLGGVLFIRPVIGIAVMSAAFLLAAYPGALQALGSLTINNLLGVCFVALLGLHIIETRDWSFAKNRQLRILAFIGILLIIGTFVSDWQFPLLQATRGKVKIIDKTDDMSHNFIARGVFLLFYVAFVRTRRDVKIAFLTFMLALYAAVPSAIINMMNGTLNRGFRIQASVTSGANPNRLAMICLMEMAAFWFWSYARPGTIRKLVALGAMGGATIVLFGTGSRSGLLGLGMLGLLMQTGPKSYRMPSWQIGALAVFGIVAVLAVVPAESWQRMITFNPQKGEIGATSNQMREETVFRAVQIFEDYPLFGIGLGNFREVSRQVYHDDFYRPPHNSYLWACAEGGIFVLLAYVWLFWVTWDDLRVVQRLSASRDQELLAYAYAVRVIFMLYMFFSVFADLWLNPITYCMLGLIVTMKRLLEETATPEVVPTTAQRQLRPALAGRAA
jgi:hypothetical protein